jgi:hypothetical protein
MRLRASPANRANRDKEKVRVKKKLVPVASSVLSIEINDNNLFS